MAKVRMKVHITGTRNGQPWPPPGEVIDLPAAEADAYCAQGYCEPVEASPKQLTEKRSMSDSKAELLEAAEGLDVDKSNTKAEILEALNG